MLQPAVASLPRDNDGGGEEHAPGKEPDQVQQPVSDEWQAAIVMRIAGAEETEKVLVEEIEVPEAMHIAECRDVADRMALVWVSEAGENVPWRSDGQKKQQAGEWLNCRQRR